MVLRPLRPVLPLLAAALLAGCTGQELRPEPAPPASGATLPAQFEAWSAAVPAYRLGEGDRLRVMFPNTPEMDEEVQVRPDGIVTLRVAGEVAVADLTTGQAGARIAEKALARLRHPAVEIAVLDPASARIFVGGEVKAPGAYRLAGPLTVMAALQLASGAAETGRLDQIVLIRRGPDDRPMLRLVDAKAFLEGRQAENPAVLPGDILYVPRTGIAEVNLWVQQFIERVVPFQRGFTYTMGHTTTNY